MGLACIYRHKKVQIDYKLQSCQHKYAQQDKKAINFFVDLSLTVEKHCSNLHIENRFFCVLFDTWFRRLAKDLQRAKWSLQPAIIFCVANWRLSIEFAWVTVTQANSITRPQIRFAVRRTVFLQVQAKHNEKKQRKALLICPWLVTSMSNICSLIKAYLRLHLCIKLHTCRWTFNLTRSFHLSFSSLP